MNHKYNNEGACEHCGIKRERRERIKIVRTYSALGRDGVWHDVSVERMDLAWYYIMPETGKGSFYRPGCVRIKQLTAIK